MKKTGIILLLITISASISMADVNTIIVLTADDLYKLALSNSAALAEKMAREKAASYRVIEAGSKGAPRLSFESTLSYIHNPDTLTVEAGDFGELPTGMGSILMPAEDTTFSLSGNNFYDFKLILDQPVFTWGKIYNAFQATKEGAAAAAVDTIKMKELIKTEILIHSTSIHYLKLIKTAIEKQNEIANRLEHISSDSYENGMILYTEYLDAQMKKKEVELIEFRIDQQLNQILLNLIYLTGKELTEEMLLTIDPVDKGNELWQDLYNDAFKNNRDLIMLRHSVNAQEYKKKIQKGTYYFKPDLAFHMELSYGGSCFPFIQEGWLDEDKGNFTMTIAIRAPLADFGTMYAAGKAAEEDLKASRSAYENSLRQIEKYIRQTSCELELNIQNIDYYNGRMETDIKMMNQKEKEWLSGYGDEIDFLSKQIDYYSNIILLYQEKIKKSANYYKLQNITGLEKE